MSTLEPKTSEGSRPGPFAAGGLKEACKCFGNKYFNARFGRLQPGDVREGAKSPEPGALLLPEPPCSNLDLLDRLLKRAGALKVVQELGITHGGPGLGPEKALLIEGSDFFQEPQCHHLPDSRIDPPIDVLCGPLQSEDAGIRPAGVLPLHLRCGEWGAGSLGVLKGSNGPPGVVGVDAIGGHRIHGLQPGPELVQRQGCQRCPQVRVGGRSIEESEQQTLYVQVGATHDDGPAASLADVRNGPLRFHQPVIQRPRFIGGDDVQEVVRDVAALFDGWRRSADVHAAIDLHGICGNALAATWKSARQLDGERSLAPGGRADEHHNRFVAGG